MGGGTLALWGAGLGYHVTKVGCIQVCFIVKTRSVQELVYCIAIVHNSAESYNFVFV